MKFSMEYNVQHNELKNQFFIDIEGKKSTLDYSKSIDGKTLDYRSTFVPSELRGHHIGEKLVIFALEYAKDNHFKVIPTCSFVKRVIDNHPEFLDLMQLPSEEI